MSKKNTPSARFAIGFVLVLAVISGGVYLAFSNFQRQAAERRRMASQENLVEIHEALSDYAAKNKGLFPERAALLLPNYLTNGRALINPAWPDETGYIYIPGARNDDSQDTILVYENVPARKRKLGIQVLIRSGSIYTMAESKFEEALKVQEEMWKRTGRVWLPDAMTSREMK